ncbi:MAG: RDD family protein, partial [Planctomycetaceae bacterium]|nr:RDD family protein [Planctomycetaceae bacterium]
KKKLKDFKPDFFGNLSMGFRFYVWPLMVMYPLLWIGRVLDIVTQNPLPGIIVNASLFSIAMLFFLPAAVVHMSQPYKFRAWLFVWAVRDFFKTILPTLYVAMMNIFLVGLVPIILLVVFLVMGDKPLGFFTTLVVNTVAWLRSNVWDLQGGPGFLFYELPIVFTFTVIIFGTLFAIMAFPAIFMMRVIGQYGRYFKPDLSIVKEVTAGEVVSFGPRFLAYQIDLILMVVMWPVALLIGFFSTFIFRLWNAPPALVELLSMVVSMFAWLIMLLQYFGAGESGAARGTMGKWSMGMIVLHEDGRPLKRGEAYTRAVCAALCAIPFYIGFLMCFFRSDRRALHDVMSKSKVVWREEEFTA